MNDDSFNIIGANGGQGLLVLRRAARFLLQALEMTFFQEQGKDFFIYQQYYLSYT